LLLAVGLYLAIFLLLLHLLDRLATRVPPEPPHGTPPVG
jgi:hypothetical protein